MSKIIQPPKDSHKWLITVLAIFLFLALTVAALIFGYQKVYAQKIYPGVWVGGSDLSGLTQTEAEELLKIRVAELDRAGFLFTYQERTVAISSLVVAPSDPDISYELVSFDVPATATAAFGVGRQGNWLNKLLGSWRVLFSRSQVETHFTLDQDRFLAALQDNFKDLENPAMSAQLIITQEGDRFIKSIEPEKAGTAFNYSLALNQLTNQLVNLDDTKIGLQLQPDLPQIKSSQVQPALAQVDSILALAPLTLIYQDKKWEVSALQLAGLLDFALNSGQVVLGINQQRFGQYLDQEIFLAVNQESKNAKFSLQGSKVVEFQGAQAGVTIDQEATRQKIESEFIINQNKEVALVVQMVPPQVATADVNNLGIKELIGVGLSNFVNSPKNRIHNIHTGAASINGMLIKPGEEFSINTALGDVDGEHGYLPEMTIKGNKTVPEFGGGLCQIGTTIFRVALSAGLPITERAPHSYRVSYYEPAGLDATIYGPHPDVRFINDTGNYILIQTSINGTELRFEFWGAKDGRTTYYIGQTESSNLYDIKPRIWGYVSPLPTKMVETLDLPVGSKKCTESAHTGATTEFDYTVTYSDGHKFEKTFRSVYRPWQAVCLIGVEQLSEPLPADEAVPANSEATPVNTNQAVNINVNQPI
ncbi:MAG: VanW family protein [Patescibacteria group bacterium]